MTDSPVLLLIFNRLETTKMVFERIREAKPKLLFIAADGPRAGKEGEKEKCDAVRQFVLNSVDWDCDVKTLFREINLGCGHAPAEAISWFFKNVEQGIVLEDDCLPALSFFNFCDQLLEKYKDDERIVTISGTNVFGEFKTTASYLFSVLGGNWGWASWKRAWQKFDFDISLWKEKNNQDKIKYFISNDEIFNHYKIIFDDLLINNRNDVWDYQWLFSRVLNAGLTIVPSINQIRNIGFGEHGTHTFDPENRIAKLLTCDIEFPLIHSEPTANKEFDSDFYDEFLKSHTQHLSIYARLKNKIKKLSIFNHFNN